MSIDVVVERIAKLTLGPHDLVVVTVPEQDAWRVPRIARELQRGKRRYPHLGDVPVLVTADGVDIDTMPEADARRLLTALQARFPDQANNG